MNFAIIYVTYLDTWVWRDQEGEDRVEDGGEGAENPAELPTVTEEHLALTAAYLHFFHTSSSALFWSIDILHIRYVDTPKKWKLFFKTNNLSLNNNLSLM